MNSILAADPGLNVSIDMTQVPDTSEAVLPASAISQISAAGLGLEISMPTGTLSLDAPALTSAAEQAAGSDTASLTLVQVDPSSLTQEQQTSLGAGNVVFNVSLYAGGQYIQTFDGMITVTVLYTGSQPVAVWYLDAAGTLQPVASSYDGTTGTVTFTTSHLSLFVLGQDNESGQIEGRAAGIEPLDGAIVQTDVLVSQQAHIGGNLILWVVIICIASVVGISLFRLSRKK